MLYELTIEEIATIDGGRVNQEAYDLGHAAGRAVAAMFTAYGIWSALAAL